MISWVLKKFEELTIHELYAILQLRNEVFAIEQNCVYPDLDNRDQPSYHLMCMQNEKLVAYARIIPPGVVYSEPSIGRVVTSPVVRGTGTGKELMNRSIQCIEELYGVSSIRISAQAYLQKFYTELGFQSIGDVYIEDSLEHIEMVKS